MKVGSNHATKHLILDSASNITSFHCDKCNEKTCGKHDNISFDSTSSTTYEEITCKNFNEKNQKISIWSCEDSKQDCENCNYRMKFVESSMYKGTYGEDTMLFKNEYEFIKDKESQDQLKNTDLFKSIIGCNYIEKGIYKEQEADGLLGLSTHTNNSSFPPSIIDQTLDEFKLNKQGFSMCLGFEGGHFRIGDMNHDFHLRNILKSHNDNILEKFKSLPEAEIQTIKYVTVKDRDYINLSYIKINNEEIDFSNDMNINYHKKDGLKHFKTFFDSGTTAIQIPRM